MTRVKMTTLLVSLFAFVCFSNSPKGTVPSTFTNSAPAPQLLKPVKWKFEKMRVGPDKFLLQATAQIDSGWHVYSHNIASGGPIPTNFAFDTTDQYKLIGKFDEQGEVEEKYDPNFDMDLKWYSDQLTLVQRVKLTNPTATVTGHVAYMTCDATRCLPPKEVDFTFHLKKEGVTEDPTNSEEVQKEDNGTTSKKTDNGNEDQPPGTAQKDTTKEDTTVAATTTSKKTNLKQKNGEGYRCPVVKTDTGGKSESSNSSRTLWGYLIAGFIGGLIAIITPCVLPMIPLTVSFFTKRDSGISSGLPGASLFGLFIILVYVGAGFLITMLLGPDALNALASNGIMNFIFFAVLVVFAISFFGAFELRVPSSWTTKSDQLSDKGGVIGVFFMAFTLVLVSFSCTGPIIGTLLVEAATSGKKIGLLAGMTGFSVALALPFTFFAAFPSWLEQLPRSGGWMNTVKVTLGFLELALALKFLSNIDLAYHWGFFKREIFFALWIIIFGMLGFYLLGKLRFPLDSKVEKISITRLMLALLSLTFAVYITPGLWGAPVQLTSGIAPPLTYREWKPNNEVARGHCPHNISCFHDYREGLAYAKKKGMPIMIDFTGWTCVNCRRMEDKVWSDPRVLDKLRNEYVLISLYVDDKTELPDSAQFVSTFSDKEIETVGNLWSEFQARCFGANSQPYYVLMGHNEKMLLPPRGYTPNVQEYLRFLNDGLKKFKKQKKGKKLARQ